MANNLIPTRAFLGKNPNDPIYVKDLIAVVNYLLDIATVAGSSSLTVFTGASFVGANYTNAALNGLTPDVDFSLLSGAVLINVTDYTFAGTTITLVSGAPAADESFLLIIK